MENAILERLMEITLFSAAIFVMVWLFRLAFGKWLSPQLRYLLWFLVVIRLLVPVTWESGFHLITLPEESPIPAAASPAPVANAQPSGAITLDGGAHPPSLADAPAPATPMPTHVAPRTERAPLTLAQWLLIAWGAGAILVLAAHAGMTLRLRRRMRALGRVPGDGTLRLYGRVQEALRLRRAPPLLLLPDIGSPALTAGLRPTLLLPDELVGGGTREEKTFSLLHELTHYRRGDHLVCLLLTALRAVWWFNPVVWLLPPRMRVDMESACDAQVVRDMDKRHKLNYAGLLLELGQGK